MLLIIGRVYLLTAPAVICLGSVAEGKRNEPVVDLKGDQSYKARVVEIDEGSQLARLTLVDGPKGCAGEKTT